MQINEIYGFVRRLYCSFALKKRLICKKERSIYQQFQFSINSGANEMKGKRVSKRERDRNRIIIIHYAPCRSFPGLIEPIFECVCVASFLSFIEC